jgi:hypothetical protein
MRQDGVNPPLQFRLILHQDFVTPLQSGVALDQNGEALVDLPKALLNLLFEPALPLFEPALSLFELALPLFELALPLFDAPQALFDSVQPLVHGIQPLVHGVESGTGPLVQGPQFADDERQALRRRVGWSRLADGGHNIRMPLS